jgi:transcriptional regulator with XRE-family HTH domain
LGTAIRYFREKFQMTKLDLAKKAKVSDDSIRRWEKGERSPRISDLEKISDVFNVPKAELLKNPIKNKLCVEFVGEVENMDIANIDTNHFNYGFRDNDILLWGALADGESDESATKLIMNQIKAARAGKRAAENELKKLESCA